MEICRHLPQHPAVQYLQNIFRKKVDCLFQWIRSPHIPCENNYAERGLRPLAVSGKISYGSQSERGMKTREILVSVLHTAAARGLEPAAFLEAFRIVPAQLTSACGYYALCKRKKESNEL